MRSESEVRDKIEAIEEDWDAANEIWDHAGANPEVGAVMKTLEWVLEEE